MSFLTSPTNAPRSGWIRAVACTVSAAVATVGLAACGGGGGGSENDLGLIEPGTLTVATNNDFRPFGFQKNGELVGFDVGIAKAIAERLSLKPNIIAVPFESDIQGIQSGRYDVAVASMAITEERDKAVDFSDPYYQGGGTMFVREDSPCTDPTKMENPTVGVARGTTYGDYAKKQPWIGNVRVYESSITAFADLVRGRLDGVITGHLSGLYQVKKGNKPLRTCGGLLYKHPIAFAVKEDSPKLLDALNKALKTIKKNGTYASLSKKWFGENISS